MSSDSLLEVVSQVRRDIIRMVHGAKSGHPGGSLGCAEFLTVLYFKIMQIDPNNFLMDGRKEDLFFLSNGHISPLLYSVLSRRGYFSVKELKTFRKINSRLQGHPSTHDKLPGVRMASGSLGQGLSVAIGAATTKKLNNDKCCVYSLHGDGELQEGQIWEAAMYAAHNKVDNLIATIDYNGKQIDGPVSKVMSLGNLRQKWESFGWIVLEMYGHDLKEIYETLNHAKTLLGKEQPLVIIMTTEMGRGIDFMEGNHEWHGIPPNDEQLKSALNQVRSTLADY